MERGDIQWWREARYGMFVHYGPFSQYYDRHVARTQSASPPAGADRDVRRRWSVEGLTPPRDFAKHWARSAKAAGMKYVVFCAKHHEGFVPWDTKLTDYNSMNMGPGFDLVAEFVKACREEGLKVGLYYSLLDGDHPDGRRCEHDNDARRRFLDFTQGLPRELTTNYGQIDLLWYDGPSPLGYAGEWETRKMNAMIRRLQPGIIINDRALAVEDFTSSEGAISPTAMDGQDWEACIEFNNVAGEPYPTWTWYPSAPETYHSPQQIIGMLRRCAGSTGNLLLNVGPNPATGSIGQIEQERLAAVGKWLAVHGEAVYGRVDRIESLAGIANDPGGEWTRKGNVAYLWLPKWPAGGTIVLEEVRTRLQAASILTNSQPLAFEQVTTPQGRKNTTRLTLSGLPEECPDKVCNYAILKLVFEDYPR